MRLLLVRHYKTLCNAAGEIMGWGDAPPVREWETDLAWVDRRLRDGGVEIDAIFSSVLKRARHTARYFARHHGIRIIHDDPALNEVDYGDLYRKPKAWVKKHYPRYKKDPDFVHPGGESFRQMQRRAVRFILSQGTRYRERTVLVVIHAGVIRALICHFLGVPYTPNLKRKISHRYIGALTIRNGRCVRYDELGKPSGFVTDGVIALPWVPQNEAAQGD